MAEDIPEPEKMPEVGGDHPRYVVGDYLNLDLTISHQMHIVEALVVYSHMDDETLVIILRGETELDEAESLSLSSRLRVSREITMEDVPGAYALTRVELVTLSTRVLTHDYERRTAFEIIPEPDLWNVTLNLDHYTREPLYPLADEDEDH